MFVEHPVDKSFCFSALKQVDFISKHEVRKAVSFSAGFYFR